VAHTIDKQEGPVCPHGQRQTAENFNCVKDDTEEQLTVEKTTIEMNGRIPTNK
jgi:hypothetical protein